MFGNVFKNWSQAASQGEGSRSFGRHLDTCCGTRNFESAIDLSLLRIGQLEHRHSETHKTVIMAIANTMRLTAMGGDALSLTSEQISRVEQASQNSRKKDLPETIFFATALVEYHGAFPSGKEREKEFNALLRLSEIAGTAPLDPEIKKLTCLIRFDSCLRFCHDSRERRALIDGVFDKAANELSTDSPSLALYYRGLMKWKIGRFTEADEILAGALKRVDGDIAEKKDTEVTKTSLLEGQLRVSLNLGKLDEAEKQAFSLINRVRHLGQSEDIVNRCKSFLVEIYTRTGEDSLAEITRNTISA